MLKYTWLLQTPAVTLITWRSRFKSSPASQETALIQTLKSPHLYQSAFCLCKNSQRRSSNVWRSPHCLCYAES